MDSLIREFMSRSRTSSSFAERLQRSLAGGETRTTVYYRPYPLVIISGSGCRVLDADGREYLDVLNNYTSLVHGHRYGPVVHAIVRAVQDVGTSHAAPHLSQVELAEYLKARLPKAELLRFTNSGSEATNLAIRLARAATGRRVVVCFEGGYHGTLPGFIDGDAETIRVPFNDLDRLASSVSEAVAAVITEPFLGSGGVVEAHPGFLAGAATIAHDAGAIFIVDEVQSLRNAFGGVHGELGLDADLVTMGKIIGGGLPVGAVGGRIDLMRLAAVADGGPVNHSGTFNGNVPTMVGGLAAMMALDAPTITHLNREASLLAARIEAAGEKVGLPVSVSRSGSIMQVHFGPTGPRRDPGEEHDEGARLRRLHLALLLEGVFAAPRGMLNLSTQMSHQDLSDIADAYERALGRVATAPYD